MAFGGAKSTRVLMASLAVLCLACQASTLVHLVVVAHVPCAEHGELIDVRAEAPLARAAVPVLGAASVALVSPAAEPPPHSHDHCAVLATRRENARVSQPPLLVLDRAVVAQPRCTAEATSPAAMRPLDVAPKSSPPV